MAATDTSGETGSGIGSGGSLVPLVPQALKAHLRLGPIIGRGSYGRVYRATYHNRRVAAKVRHPPMLRWLVLH